MKNKKQLLLILFFLFLLPFSNNLKHENKVKAINTKTRYNLCAFISFADEEDEINTTLDSGYTPRQLIDNTYNNSPYSYHDYFYSVSNHNVDMKTVYLFPNETGFDSFKLDNSRSSYAKKSDTNPNGYDYEGTAINNLQIDWSSKLQSAINKGILPCSINDRNDTIPYSALDSTGNKIIDCITLIFAPQKDLNYTASWGEPLYPCKATCSRISIPLSTGTTLTSCDYNQWVVDYSTIYKDSKDSSTPFFSNGVGMHEMGHAFGLLDLYDYNRRYYPVGNMSMMSNVVTPIAQFITSRERETMGWLNSSNIKRIEKSGEYTLDAVSTFNEGVICYKMPLEGFTDKWLYIEYRVFDDSSINRFDSKNRELYSINGNAVNGLSGKSGVLVYVADSSQIHPTNSPGRPQYFGIDILCGSNTNRTDAPRVEGDIVNVSAYNSDGQNKYTGAQVEVLEIKDGKAKIKVTSPYLSENDEITNNEIKNEALYNKLLSLSLSNALYDISLDSYDYIDLSFLDINSLDFLDLFTFKQLKYLILTGNNITSLDKLNSFITSHPQTVIVLDNNDINLTTLDTSLLNNQNIFYGIQNIKAKKNQTVTYNSDIYYHINESFSISDFSIYYETEGGSSKQLKRGLNKLTLDDGLYSFTTIMFFSDSKNTMFKYLYNIQVKNNTRGIELSNSQDTYQINESFTIPYIVKEGQLSDYTISIYINSSIVSKLITDSFSFNSIGSNDIRIDVLNKTTNYSYSLTYKVSIIDSLSPTISLIGDKYYPTMKAYQECGVEINDNSLSSSKTVDKAGTYDSLILEISSSSTNNYVGDVLKSTTYIYIYTVKDTANNTSSITRTVEIFNPDYIIDNQVEFFTISLTIYNSDNQAVTDTKNPGSYTYSYLIKDRYNNQITITRVKVVVPTSTSISSSSTSSNTSTSTSNTSISTSSSTTISTSTSTNTSITTSESTSSSSSSDETNSSSNQHSESNDTMVSSIVSSSSENQTISNNTSHKNSNTIKAVVITLPLTAIVIVAAVAIFFLVKKNK